MRKKSHYKILKVESKEQHLNTVPNFCLFQKKLLRKIIFKIISIHAISYY